jgi:hypothetical protein
MKKARILFLLCLVAALTIGMAVSASAEPNEELMHTDLYVESLPVPTAGEAIAPFGFTPPESQFAVTGTWYVYDYQTQAATVATGNFEDGKLYQLQLTATAAEGWAFHGPYLNIYDTGEYYQFEYFTDAYNAHEMTFSIPAPCGKFERIDHVPVIGLPADIAPGAAMTVPTLTSKYEDVNITAQWVDAEYAPASGTFEDGKVYYLQLTITAKEGYLLRNWIDVSDLEGDRRSNGQSNGIQAVVNFKYSLMPKVNQVDITGVTGAVIGQAPTTSGIQAPENVHYALDGANWHNETTYEDFTIFADANKYCLYIYVRAEDGYEFAEDAVVTVNGQEVESVTINDEYVEICMSYSFLKQIDKVDITIPAPQIGQTITLDNIVLPAGMELDMISSYWYELATEVIEGENYIVQKPVEGTFLKGHRYYLELRFYVQPGYEFTEEAELYINSVSINEIYDSYGYLSDSGGYLQTCYSFLEIVNKVEITGVTTPVVGQTATTEGIQISGVGYYDIYWMEEGSDSPDPFTGKFEVGKSYCLQIDFLAAEGTEFAEGCVITVNGKEPDDGWAGGEGGHASLRYSFKALINKIEITGMPQFSVGGTASVGSLKAPEGANYEVIGLWEAMNEDYDDSYTGTFKADGVYMLVIFAQPKDGYEFAEDAQFLIDGKVPETSLFNVFSDYAAAQYYFAPAYQDFGKLELTVKDPVIGGKVEDHTPKAPEGAKYELEAVWIVSEDGKTWRQATGTFQEGKYYMLRLYVNIRSDVQDVWFGNDPQASINGVDIVWDHEDNYAGPTYMEIRYEVGMLCNHTYSDWTSVNGKTHSKTCSKCGDVITENHAWESNKDTACDTCGYKRSDNPATGDAIVPACLLALCSLTALVVIKRRNVN